MLKSGASLTLLAARFVMRCRGTQPGGLGFASVLDFLGLGLLKYVSVHVDDSSEKYFDAHLSKIRYTEI